MSRICRKAAFVVLVGYTLAFVGCAGSREARDVDDTAPDPAEEEVINLADYEDFDPAPYGEEAPPEAIDVTHDVPESLMEGRAASGTARTVQGYRIQILNTVSKQEADKMVEDLIAWWNEQRSSGSNSDLFRQEQPPVYTIYRQPYYRVRVGDFATRAQVQRVLPTFKQRFSAALIVPDTVTIYQ